MISAHQSKLSQMVQQQANSFEYHSHVLKQVKSQLKLLQKDNGNLIITFESFRNSTLELTNEWIKRINSFLYRQLKQKHYLQNQIEKSRIIQQNMKCQVIKLKEMIQLAIQDYQKQLQDKNEIVKQKDQEIQVLIRQLKVIEKQQTLDQSIRIEQSRNTERQSLQIIQEESQHATHSSAALSLRDFKDQKFEESIIIPKILLPVNQIACDLFTAHLSQSELQQKENFEPKYEHKRTKTFIDHFRKTIGQSFSQKNEQQKPMYLPKNLNKNKTKSSFTTFKQPLRQFQLNQMHPNNRNQSFSHNLKECPKQPVTFKTVYMHTSSGQISNSSSNSDLINNNQVQRINIPKKFQTPINLMLFKKKETPINRVMTEPSPQRLEKYENNYFSSKPSNSQKRIFHEKKSSCQQSRSNHSIQDSKSIKSSLSKQKIKITAKMIDEVGHSAKKTANNHNKALVYLGGKSIFRKFLIELKTALKKYSIITGTSRDEVKYEGNRKNGMRWGSGKLIYQNGFIFEGEFKENMRHGRGVLTMNGISIYEGLWSMDRLHGQGYIKSMKYMSSSCPSIFNEASYCGNLLENRLHGIGTIFLNSKQKIVTKFLNGTPVGDLTYYNFHQIQFGVWPSQ